MKSGVIYSLTALSIAMFSANATADDALNCASGPGAADVGPSTQSSAAQKLNVAVLTQTANGQALLCVNERNASRSTLIGVIGSLQMDTKLVGMDYRVQDGKLYAVGNMGGVYTIDTATAATTFVNRLSIAPDGALFGVDFNPAADRLRIVSDKGQNLRHNVNANGVTIADTALNNGASPPVGVAGVVSAAYTNNDVAMPTATALFVINGTTDAVALQSPANSGIVVGTGNLGVNTTGAVGFDIYSTLRNGAATSNRALASATPEGQSTAGLYTVDVLTGAARLASKFASGVTVLDIAIPLNQKLDD